MRKGPGMEYRKVIRLKDGRECILRSGTEKDAAAVLKNFILTHTETEFLSSYPDEIRFTVEQEEGFIKKMAASPDEIEILAEVGGKVVGLAGINHVGGFEKVKHRAGFGISVLREYWRLGIGRALTEACIECAREAGYLQLELEVVTENKAAVALYESLGFVEFGRNPLGFRCRESGMMSLSSMRLEL